MSTLILFIEVAGSLLVAGAVLKAIWLLLRFRTITPARIALAQGAIAGLSFKAAASLLKTIVLESWRQIAMFAVILTLRTILKRIFAWELKGARLHDLRFGSHFTSGTPVR